MNKKSYERYHFNWLFLGSAPALCAALCNALNLATKSVESLAALTANVLGITNKALAYSEMANCSRDPYAQSVIANSKKRDEKGGGTRVVAKFSR